MYPLPDNVTLKTEEIVRYGRCEMRAGIIDRMAQDKKRLNEIWEKPKVKKLVTQWLEKNNITPATVTKDKAIVALVSAINKIVEDQQAVNRKKFDELLFNCKGQIVVEGEGEVKCPETQRDVKTKLKKLRDLLTGQLKKSLGRAQELRQYLDVAVVYEFEFEITEQNTNKGEVAFRLPLVSQTIDADASAALLLTRKGKRTFKTQDGKWGRLITDEALCKDFSESRRNVLYPLGGSIGVDRVVSTFTDLIDQGGAKDSFVDILVFTTEVSGGVNGTIKLSPVPQAFRLVSAGAHLFGSRVDIHKLTLSLVFPKQDSSDAVFGTDRFDGDLDTPFERPAEWRARYNLCVADARGREDAIKQLRQTAPEIYCIEYADYFEPQYGRKDKDKDKEKEAPQMDAAPADRKGGDAPRRFEPPERRPNR